MSVAASGPPGSDPSTRVRLFVALDLPDAARDGIAEWGRQAVGGRPGVRLRSKGSLHVTLCFLGAQAAGDIAAIGRACAVAVGGCESAALALSETVLLPRRRPRTLAVAVQAAPSGEALAPLQAAVADALTAGGWYAPERRPFFAHVTVARLRPAAAGLSLDRLTPLSITPFVAPSVSLYQSHTGPAGARYEPVARVALGR